MRKDFDADMNPVSWGLSVRNFRMVASFEYCFSRSTQSLFPLKVISLFYSKYEAEPDSQPLSKSEMEPIVKIAIVENCSILDINRSPRYIRLGKTTFQKPPDVWYYTFKKHSGTVELKKYQSQKNWFWPTLVLELFKVNSKDALLKAIWPWKDTFDFNKIVNSHDLECGTVSQIAGFISHSLKNCTLNFRNIFTVLSLLILPSSSLWLLISLLLLLLT